MTIGKRAIQPKRGDIVLIPFPFAELTATKARPALVVSARGFFEAEGKMIVAAITSNVRAHRGRTNLYLRRWKEAGLLKPSVVTSWLATLSPELVLMRIGNLGGPELGAVGNEIRYALDL